MSSFTPTTSPRVIRQLQTIDLPTLTARIAENDSRKVDKVIGNVQDLRLVDGFKLATKQGLAGGQTQRLVLSDNALNQLCTKLGIGTRYARRILNDPNDGDGKLLRTLIDQANHWLDGTPAKPVLVRMKGEIDPSGGGGRLMARALLSKDYQIFDNKHVMEALNRLDGTSMKIQEPFLDDDNFYVRIILPDLKFDISPSGRTRGDILAGTLLLYNSETGRGKTGLEVGVTRLSCTNGMTAEECIYRFAQSHRGLTTDDLFDGLGNALDNVQRIVSTVGQRFQAAHEVPVTDPVAELKKLVARMDLPDYMADKVQSCFFEEAFNTVFGVTNAITLAAQEQPLDRRRQMEAFAGDYLFRETRDLVGSL